MKQDDVITEVDGDSSIVTRRTALKLMAATTLGIAASGHAHAETSAASPVDEILLTDEPPIGYYGTYDLDYFGPPAERNVKKNFVFPRDVESEAAYGIDISHYTNAVPWGALKAAKVNYVYIKSSESRNGRDGAFESNWKGCSAAGIPSGAYHFLTAKVDGTDQAEYFLKRLVAVGGLKAAHLQPVVDLEWDTYGPDFKRVVVGHSPKGEPLYKDYWDDIDPLERVTTVKDAVQTIISGLPGLSIKPIIYTNRSWWDDHIPAGTVFEGATVWISDYRSSSYKNNSPRSVSGHKYHLWQFTDSAKINVAGTMHGPYDANRLVFGTISDISIS